MTIIETF